MGDVGEYWREHKEHKRDVSAARSMGLSVEAYRRRLEAEKAKDRAEAKAKKLARHTIQCECGRTFFDKSAHNCHKTKTGKLGHKGTEIIPSRDSDNA